MITRLRAKNFKSWKDTQELRLAPLTGLFGTNSSGKTSILQVLLMLKQTVESPDRKQVLYTGDYRDLVDLGTFSDFIYDHQSDASLLLALSWDFPEPLAINNPERSKVQLYNIKSLSFTTSIHEDIHEESRRPVVESFAYQLNDHRFGMIRKNSDRNAEQDRYDLIHVGYNAKRVQGREWPLPAPVKCYGFPDEATGYYQNTGFLPDFVLSFERLFSRLAYLSPIRDYPERSYVWAGDSPENVGRDGELTIPALLASRTQGKTISRGRGQSKLTVEERVALWLRKMRLIQSFSIKPIAPNRRDYEVRVRQTAKSPEVLITGVGFGVSQILPVLVLCYYIPRGSIILLEQPEIRLHPAVQSDLADVLIDVVKNRNVQVIVESHSEHLLRRLQRRIAEGMIAADDLALYFCRIDKGASKIDRLNVDEEGNITNWPPGFFGDEMGDLIAMSEAAFERERAGRS